MRLRIEDIQGWFTWEWLYDWAARYAGRSVRVPTFVEVGVWKGRSIAYLCRKLLAYNRRPFHLIAVDTWNMKQCGDANAAQRPHLDALRSASLTLYDEYRRNMLHLGYDHLIDDWRMRGVDAAMAFDRRCPADFVFIDGDHAADAVAADVAAWRPLATVLCGHDWSQRSVRDGLERAGGAFFPLPFMDCWTTSKPLADLWTLIMERQAELLLDEAKEGVLCPI